MSKIAEIEKIIGEYQEAKMHHKALKNCGKDFDLASVASSSISKIKGIVAGKNTRKA